MVVYEIVLQCPVATGIFIQNIDFITSKKWPIALAGFL